MSSPGASKIESVIALLTSLAAGDYDARGPRFDDDEDYDAVIVGINMLAEELGAHRAELEQRVQARTAELEEARREALEASRLKSEFLATMSHEIRTPMNGVVGLTRLLRQTRLDETQRQYVEALQSAGDALLSVINDILDFSKLEAGMVDLELVDFDPRLLLEGVLGLVAPHSSRSDLALVAYCLPEVARRLVGDEGRLRQILLNLASNAVKFTEQGEVVIRASVSGQDGGVQRVRFEVADTGVGIADHARQRLFDAFTQADSSTTRRYGGTGLGLAISRHLCEAMGGTIGVRSEVGAGSTFWFEVPLAVSAQPASPAPGQHMLEGVRVLVVDDSASSRLALETRLTEWAMRPDVVEHSLAAVGLLRSALAAGDPYPLAIVDADMPELDGMELAALVAAEESLRGTSVVMLVPTLEADRQALRRLGVRATLTKPVRSSELLDRLVELVARDPAALTGPAAVPTAAAPEVPARAKVLVVEDNPVNQLVAQGLVANLGYEVDVVENGVEALAALAGTAYSAVLMDCHMPVMDGYAATARIRQRQSGAGRVPIIAMTAAVTPQDRARCLAAGMDDYIAKPIDPSVLGDVLDRWTRDRPGSQVAAPAPPDRPTVIDPERLAVLRAAVTPEGEPLLPALTRAFARSAPGLLEAMRHASGDQDTEGLRRAAHELLGAAGSVGAARVAELARRVEDAAGGAPATLRSLLDLLEQELGHARRLLSAATPLA